jgi:cytoskeletal protein RodZ
MKQCPICLQVYNDSENFCQNEGSTLSVISSEQRGYSTSPDTPTVFVKKNPTVQNSAFPVKQTSPILYGLIGGLAVLVLVLGGFLLYPKNSNNTEKVTNDSEKKNTETESKNSEETTKTATNTQQSFQSNNQPSAKPIAPPVPPPIENYVSPSGTWQGQWTNGKAYYGQQLTLQDNGNGKVSGQIIHTLQRSSNPQKMDKVGLTAVEFVQGSYNPNTRIITLAGVRKNDPNDLIILDKYRLSLSGDSSTIAGETVGGKIRGKISLRR